MSDQIRDFLREAAGPTDAAPPDLAGLVRRSRRRRVGRAAAGVAALAAVGVVAVGVVDLPRSTEVEPVVEPAPGPTSTPEASPAEPVAPGVETLRFTFTGADGPDGCWYDGPSLVTAGIHEIEFVDGSAGQQGMVGIEPLAEGYDLQDFEESLRDEDGGASAGQESPTPPLRLDRRTEYEWRPEPSTSFGLEGLRIVQGPDIDLDEVSLPPGTHALYCAVQLDEPELYELWPVAELTVVEAP